VDVRGECGNAVFVCCLTNPPDQAAWGELRRDFGDVVVEVDADRLLSDVRAAIDPRDEWQRNACVMLWPAQYTKGLERKRLSLADREMDAIRQAVTQKPPRFAHQHEQRLALISNGQWQTDGTPPRHLTVQIPRRLDYALIVSVRIATVD
jgi:hypothetical protein